MYLFVNFRWILCWLPLDIEKGYQRNGMCTCFPEKDFIVTRNPEQTWNAQECLQSKVTKNEVQFCPNWEPVHWEVDQRRPPGGREFWGVFFRKCQIQLNCWRWQERMLVPGVLEQLSKDFLPQRISRLLDIALENVPFLGMGKCSLNQTISLYLFQSGKRSKVEY